MMMQKLGRPILRYSQAHVFNTRGLRVSLVQVARSNRGYQHSFRCLNSSTSLVEPENHQFNGNASTAVSSGQLEESSTDHPASLSLTSEKTVIDCTFESLLEETTYLIDHLEKFSNPNETNALSDDGRILEPDDFYHALGGWLSLVKAHGIEAANNSRRLLNALVENQRKYPGNATFLPRTSYFDSVLMAYVTLEGHEAAIICEEIVSDMIEKCHHFISSDDSEMTYFPQPSTKTFNLLLNAWSKSGHADAGKRADEVLLSMNEWNKKIDDLESTTVYRRCNPGADTASTWIDCWNSTRHVDTLNKALKVFDTVFVDVTNTVENDDDIISKTFRGIEPTIILTNVIIKSLVYAKKPTEAEGVLRRLLSLHSSGLFTEVKPSAITYSLIINAWARSETRDGTGQAADRAEKILLKMVDQYQTGIGVTPTVYHFTPCLSAWSKCLKATNAPERAEALYDMLVDLYKGSGDENLKPDVDVGNALINCWARHHRRDDSTEKALAALKKVSLYAQPDIVTYNTVLNNLGKKGKGILAKEQLHHLETMFKEGNFKLRPDTITYNCVLTAISRSNHPDAASETQELLDRMEKLHLSGMTWIRPDTHSYSPVIYALRVSKLENKAEIAYSLIQSMVNKWIEGKSIVKPNVYVLTSFIQCCGSVEGNSASKNGALKLAFEAMELMEKKEFGPPNDFVYCELMKVIQRLTPDRSERLKSLEKVFRNCAEKGYVSRSVLREVYLGTGRDIDSSRLKKTWSRHVPVPDQPYATL